MSPEGTGDEPQLRNEISLTTGRGLWSLQDKGGEGAKELEEFGSDRMNVVQLDVCSDEQVNRAVDHVRENLPDSDKGK